MLHNFGGNIEMYGILDAISSGPIDARRSNNSTMVYFRTINTQINMHFMFSSLLFILFELNSRLVSACAWKE